MKYFNSFAIIVISLLLVGCPVRVNVEVKNESAESIFVIYSSTYQSEVEAGQTGNESYQYNCVKIKYQDEIIEYFAVVPPRDFYNVGVFSSTLYATFTNTKELILHHQNGLSETSLKLKEGCNEPEKS